MILVIEHMEDLKDVIVLKQYAKLHPENPFKSYNQWILKQKDKDLIDKWILYELIDKLPKERMRDEKILIETPKGPKLLKCRYCEETGQAFVKVEKVLKVMEG